MPVRMAIISTRTTPSASASALAHRLVTRSTAFAASRMNLRFSPAPTDLKDSCCIFLKKVGSSWARFSNRISSSTARPTAMHRLVIILSVLRLSMMTLEAMTAIFSGASNSMNGRHRWFLPGLSRAFVSQASIPVRISSVQRFSSWRPGIVLDSAEISVAFCLRER